MVYLQCIGREEEDTRQPPLFIILMTIQQTNKAGSRSQFNVFDYSLANIEIKKSKRSRCYCYYILFIIIIVVFVEEKNLLFFY